MRSRSRSVSIVGIYLTEEHAQNAAGRYAKQRQPVKLSEAARSLRSLAMCYSRAICICVRDFATINISRYAEHENETT
jgi:hypothetical protein